MAAVTEYSISSMTLRLILALVMGALIGVDRETAGHPAGVRTFSLVCIGACITMVIGEYLYSVDPNTDPSRIAAQVVSGIGFLGVGTIVVTGKKLVRGLSTAASLWAAAALGIMIGAGMLKESIIAFVLILFVILVLTPLSHMLDETNRRIDLYLEIDKGENIPVLFDFIQSKTYRISNLEKMKSQSVLKDDIDIAFTVDMKKRKKHELFLAEISALPYVRYVEEIK